MRLVAAAICLALLAGCSVGDIQDFDYAEDLPSDVLQRVRALPDKELFVADAAALPWFILRHGEIRREHSPDGLRAKWRGVYISGIFAQRYWDASFDRDGKNLSYRITDLWCLGIAWRWDELKWVDPDGRTRRYLDATILFGAFGYSSFDEGHDLVLLWLPFPLP